MRIFKNLQNIIPLLLPFAIPFSRSVADITIVFIASVFLFKSYIENDWDWVKEKWFKFAIIFLLYCVLINSPLSINSFESLKYSIFFIRWPLFALALGYWIFTDADSLKKFFFMMGLVLIFLIFDTWYQYYAGVDIFGFDKYSETRLTGPFRRPYIGMWLTKLIILPIFLFALHEKFIGLLKGKHFFVLAFIFLGVFFLTIFITGERMALLMAILSILIISLGLIASNNISIFKIVSILILLSIGTYLFSILYPAQTERAIYSTIDKILNWKDSDYGLVWKSAYDVWQESPLFGAGLHKYREACGLLGTYGTVDNAVGNGVCFHPHNISMQLLSETGIIGFVLFFSMVISLSIRTLKAYLVKKDWLLFFLTLNVLLACFLPIQSNTDFFSNKYSSLVWLLVGVVLSVCRYKEKSLKNTKN